MGRSIYLILAILIVLPSTFAIGFYIPEEREFLFVAGGTAQYALGLIGADRVPINLELQVDEALRPFVQISDTQVVLEPKEIRKILVTVNFPQIYVEPGVYTIHVVAREGRSGGGIGATAAMRHKMLVINPGQGIYPKASLYADNAQFEEPTGWQVSLVNYGLKQVQSAYADFEVFDRNGELVAQGTTPRKSVKFRQTVDLETDLLVPDGTPGRHTIKATVHADEWTTVLERDLVLGRPDIELSTYTNTFTIGRINEFQMGLRNIWENTLEGSARLKLNAQGQELSATNPKVTLIPWQGDSHSMFVNVPAELEAGTYNGVLELHFLDEPIEYPVSITLEEIAPPSTSSPLTGFNIVPWLLIALAAGLIMFFIYRKKDKKQEEAEDDYF